MGGGSPLARGQSEVGSGYVLNNMLAPGQGLRDLFKANAGF